MRWVVSILLFWGSSVLGSDQQCKQSVDAIRRHVAVTQKAAVSEHEKRWTDRERLRRVLIRYPGVVAWWTMASALEIGAYILHPFPRKGPIHIWNRSERKQWAEVQRIVKRSPHLPLTQAQKDFLIQHPNYEKDMVHLRTALQKHPTMVALLDAMRTTVWLTPKMYAWLLIWAMADFDESQSMESYITTTSGEPNDFVELIWDISYFPHFAIRIKEGPLDLVYSFSKQNLLVIPFAEFVRRPTGHLMQLTSGDRKISADEHVQAHVGAVQDIWMEVYRLKLLNQGTEEDRHRLKHMLTQVRKCDRCGGCLQPSASAEEVDIGLFASKDDEACNSFLAPLFSRYHSRSFVFLRLNMTAEEVHDLRLSYDRFVLSQYPNVTLVNDCSAMAYMMLSHILPVPRYVSVSPTSSLAYLKVLRAQGHSRVGKITYVNPHMMEGQMDSLYRLRNMGIGAVEAYLHVFGSWRYVIGNSTSIDTKPIMWLDESSVALMEQFLEDVPK